MQQHPVETFINRIGCAVPEHDVHRKFVEFAPLLLADRQQRQVFARMAERCQIAHRFACLPASSDPSESGRLEELLSFLHFADGCAAALASARPFGIAIKGFGSAVLPATADHITWKIGAQGFMMHLSGQVPGAIARHLRRQPSFLPEKDRGDIALWAIHPGGHAILDAVETGLALSPDSLFWSHRVLRDYGNMSSATVLFVLREIMDRGAAGAGCAMAFGPGIAVETMRFRAPR